MDPDGARRRQSLKIIISEAIMVVSVIFMVVILAFLVSGYWINSDFKVERQGLLQISSIPTGAAINIDGDSSWFQRTDTSKVLSSGNHSIVLTKEGYDSWSKTVNISEGLLYRLHYPRLFLQNTVAEEILDTRGAVFSSFSPEGNKLLLLDDTSSWRLVSLEDEHPKVSTLDFSSSIDLPLFRPQEQQAASTASILSADWDQDGSHILISTQQDYAIKWVLLDIRNTEKSVNLTEIFDSNFSQVQILDHSSNNLLAIENGSLRTIDVSGRTLSSILVQGVTNCDHYDTNEIIFSAVDTENPDDTNNYIGILKINDGNINKLADIDQSAKVAMGKFYDDKFIVVLQNNILNLYAHKDFEKKATFTLNFTPDILKVGHNGEFIVAYSGDQIATLDLESESVTEWTADAATFGWVDSDMIYAVSDTNELIVYDYDGNNRRTVAHKAAVDTPAIITANKWLHFFSDGHLMRQQIAD